MMEKLIDFPIFPSSSPIVGSVAWPDDPNPWHLSVGSADGHSDSVLVPRNHSYKMSPKYQAFYFYSNMEERLVLCSAQY